MPFAQTDFTFILVEPKDHTHRQISLRTIPNIYLDILNDFLYILREKYKNHQSPCYFKTYPPRIFPKMVHS